MARSRVWELLSFPSAHPVSLTAIDVKKLWLLRGEQEPTPCQHQLVWVKGLILKNFTENVLHKVQQAI